jgi:hypothetical protein
MAWSDTNSRCALKEKAGRKKELLVDANTAIFENRQELDAFTHA